MIQALLAAAALPANVNVGAGPQVPVNYASALYNGIAITAAQVTPSAFLNIVPKVANKVAEKRAVVPAPLVPPILPVVAAPPDPRLPPDNILQPLLAQNQWGNAFMGLVQDIQTPIQITIDSINSIFTWEKETVGRNLACRASYVQAVMDLLQLPSGINLFRNIIIAHHCLPSLPKLSFASRNTESKISLAKDNKVELSEINLQWQANMHSGGESVCIATNTHIPAPVAAGYPGKGCL
ncbi:MAG: hypothetical protein LBB16_02810 [Puniceicoccales bacterium]|jgi:hypothetical protein|nr:hypothetical protein [Puniceicoccales bacterium]